MKYQLLLVSLLAAFCINQAEEALEITVAETSTGIKLSCSGGAFVKGYNKNGSFLDLSYADGNTGEYYCTKEDKKSQIYVKFRTCDNCVELDTASIAGLVVGDVVATIVVGVAVYLFASQAQAGQVKSTKKRSDKQNLIRNEAAGESNYQQLRFKKGDKVEYDVLNRK